jgi:hypothetical protein
VTRFLRVGHTPTLAAAPRYFDVSFMAWVLLELGARWAVRWNAPAVVRARIHSSPDGRCTKRREER